MTQQYLFQDYVEAWRARREQERDHGVPRRRWYRFTLWKMVVAFVLIGVVFAYLRNTHWGYLAGERIRDIGQQFGLVQSPDPSKIRVSAVRPFGNLDYEWRISVPQGHDYKLDVHHDEDRFPIGFISTPNESLVSFWFRKRKRDSGIQNLILDVSDTLPRKINSGWTSAPTDVEATYAKKEVTGILWGEGEQEFNPGDKILLYRSEITDSKGDWGTTYQRRVQIAIWLVPALPQDLQLIMNSDPSSQPSSPQAEASPKPIKRQQLTLPRQLPLPQFSIWTVMVFTAFVLLAASHWWTSIQLDLARKHVKRAEEKVRETHDNAYDRILKVRSEMQRGLNHLDIDQYDQTHVGFLPQSATHYWQWRIRIPEGCRYRLYFMLDFPYQSQRTEADWNIILEPGEGMVSFRIVQTTHGEFEVIRTIDWIDEQNQRPEPAPVRVVDIRELDVTENSWLRGVWDPLVIEGPFAWGSDYTAIKTKHYEVQTLDGMGYLQQKAYDPRDLIPLVDFVDPNGKQVEGVYIWLEPVKEQQTKPPLIMDSVATTESTTNIVLETPANVNERA